MPNFISIGVKWTKHKGTPDFPLDGKYLNEIHHRYIKTGVYDAINEALLGKYLST